MQTKESVLGAVREAALLGVVTKDELAAAFDQSRASAGLTGMPAAAAPATAPVNAPETHALGIAEILYYIGGAIVFAGIAIFIGQNWSLLTFPLRLFATMGAGIAAFTVGVIFSRDSRFEGVGAAFYLISALVLPMGFYVVLDNAGIQILNNGPLTIVTSILFAVYLSSFLLFRQTVLLLFSILFGTWLFYACTNLMVGHNPYFAFGKFNEYRALASGVAYLLLAHHFSQGLRSGLSGFLYMFGINGLLLAALVLGGWSPNQNVLWELAFPILVFGTLFASVYAKSRALLIFSTIYLMVYIGKITGEYFSHGLGWPLALVLAGLLMIATGFVSVSLNRKYLRAPSIS